MRRRRLVLPPLGVSPELVGASLASPRRRITAFILDCFLLVLPTFFLTLVLAALVLLVSDPNGFEAIVSMMSGKITEENSAAVMRDIAPLLHRTQARGMPPSAALAVEQSDLRMAGEILSEYELDLSIVIMGDEPPLAPGHVRLDVRKLFPGLVRGSAVFLTAILYFTLLTAGRRKGTAGKRLLGIRVVRLDGKPLSLWESFERVGGYLASLGTLGIGLLDLWRDPNRRLAHDRIANTVVIDSGSGA